MLLTPNSSVAASYLDLAKAGRVFCSLSSITAPNAYSTTTALKGALLWNGTGPLEGSDNLSAVMAVILGVGIGWTTAPSATGVMGVAVGSGQTSAPSSTTQVTAVGNLRADVASNAPGCGIYNGGTVTNAASAFLATHSISTAGAPSQPIWVPLDGLIVVPPGSFAVVAAQAAIASLVAEISLVWAEIPL